MSAPVAADEPTAVRPAAATWMHRQTSATSTAARAATLNAHAPEDVASFERFAGSAFGVAQIERALGTSPVSDLRPVGTTSVVFRANLDAPFRAALKLATHERPLAPATEVAAFRLSRCLGLTTVPPAVLRRIPVQTLQLALDRRYLDGWSVLSKQIATDSEQDVEAAAIFWIEGMRELPIASPEGREPAWQALRQGSSVAPGLQLMAAQLSNLVVFDLLLGNGDRWSGGNVQGDPTGQWLYLRDHDLALATHLRSEVEARLHAQAAGVERFSRDLIARLRELSPERLEREWSKDPLLGQRDRWLRDQVLPGVLQRRQRVLAHVQSLIDRYGEGAVLAFP